MDDNQHRQMVFEENRKSMGVTYLLWILFGWLGVHRFYTGNTKSGLVQLLLTMSMFGLFVSIPWWIIDSILIPGMVNDRNLKTIEMIRGPELIESPHSEMAHDDPPRLPSKADRKRDAMLDDLRSTGYKRDRRGDSNLFR